jgi:polysaccharide biosynthesis/export protein
MKKLMCLHPMLLKVSLLVLLLICVHNVSAQDESYTIRKGDMLNVAVMGHPEFSMERVLVLPDGTIQFPGLGSIQASGMSIKDFTTILSDNVSKYVVNPVVTVFISLLPSQVINVVGYVNRPGQIPVFEPASVLEVISKAGGIKSLRKCKKIMIVRTNQVYEELSVKKLLSEKNKGNIPIVNVGDTVYVIEPRENFNWAMLTFFVQLGYISIQLISYLK